MSGWLGLLQASLNQFHPFSFGHIHTIILSVGGVKRRLLFFFALAAVKQGMDCFLSIHFVADRFNYRNMSDYLRNVF